MTWHGQRYLLDHYDLKKRPYTHTHTHTHTHSNTHTHTQTKKHTHTLSLSLSHSHTHTHTRDTTRQRRQRHLLDHYDLKKRQYLCSTSMTAELSFLVANFAHCRPGKMWVCDTQLIHVPRHDSFIPCDMTRPDSSMHSYMPALHLCLLSS